LDQASLFHSGFLPEFFLQSHTHAPLAIAQTTLSAVTGRSAMPLLPPLAFGKGNVLASPSLWYLIVFLLFFKFFLPSDLIF